MEVVQEFDYWPDFYGITDGCQVIMNLLSLNETEGYLVGEVENVVEGSMTTFSNIYISDPGDYQLLFETNCSDRLENYSTDVFSIKRLENVTIEVVEPNVTIYFDFTLRITASNDCRGYAHRYNDSKYYEYTTENGVAEIKVYVESTDPVIFITYCGGLEAETNYIFPKELNFDLQLLDSGLEKTNILTSRQTVFAQIKIVNEMGEVESKNYNKGTYPFMLRMFNNSQEFSGISVLFNEKFYDLANTDYQGQTENGVALIPVNILSSGEFVLEVYNNNEVEINFDSFEFTSQNFLKTIEPYANFTTVFSPSYFEIKLFGDDENSFIQPLDIQIKNENYENQLIVCVNEKGFCLVDGLILNKIGFNEIIFNSIDLNTTFILEAKPIKIQVEYLGNETLTSRDKFLLSSYLVDFTESEYIRHSVPDSCILTLSIQSDNSSLTSGEKIIADSLSKTSTDGVLNFTNVQILSMGAFSLVITPNCEYIMPWISEFQLINFNFPQIDLQYSPEITVYSYFDVQAKIFGDDFEPYLGNCDYLIHSPFIETGNYSSVYSGESINITLYTEEVGNLSGKVECNSNDSNLTSFINIKSFKQQLKISFTSDTPYNFDPFNVSVQLLSKDGFLLDSETSFTYTSEITLKLINLTDNTEASSDTFTGLLTKNMDYNSDFNNLEITQNGSYVLQASSNNSEKVSSGETDQIDISNIIIPKFKIRFSDIAPTKSSEIFSIKIFTYHSDSIPLENVRFSVIFSKLSENSTASGEVLSKELSNKYTSDSSGLVVIEGLRILSSGDFVFSVFYKDEIKAVLETGVIKNAVGSIEVNCPNSAYINFPTTVSYQVFGEDENEFLLDSTITISESSGFVFSGVKTSTVNIGSFSIQIASDSIYNFKLSNSLNSIIGTCGINGNKNRLSLSTNFDALSSVNNSQVLTFAAIVYGKTINDVETYNGIYSLTISGVSSGYTSTLPLNTIKGLGSASIQILIPGTYTFKVNSHSQIASSYSKTLKILETLKQITYTLSPNQPINTLIQIPIIITGYSGAVYTKETKLSLSCTGGVIENPIITTTTGTATFNLYSTTRGRIDCIISPSGYDYSVPLYLNINQDRSNTDPRCLIENSASDCYICVSNSREDSNGLCQCTDFSTFNSVASTCDCKEGYNSVNTYCVTCGYFYKPSQISAYYGENYNSLVVDFSLQATASTFECTKAFSLTSSLKVLVSSCQWTSTKSFVIYFNQTVSGEIFSLEIDPSLVQKVEQGTCANDVQRLLITTELKYSKPVPVVTLYAPSQVSVLCSTSTTIVYTTTYGAFYTYSWSSSDKDLDNLISTQKGTEVQIPSSIFLNPSYEISLKITDSVLLTSASSSVTFEILSQKVLSVGFSLGDSITYKVSETLSIASVILNACGESSFTYSWTLLENSVENLETLNKIKTTAPEMLQINAGVFSANSKYIITVTVTSSNNVVGSGSISIFTLSSNLSLKLSSSSGSLSPDYDVSVTAIVSDPDDQANQDFVYLWTCSQEGQICEGTDGGSLIKDSSSNILFIDKSRIRTELYFTFQVSVSTPSKSGSTTSEIDFYFSSLIKGHIILENDYGLLNSDDPIILLPYIELDGEREITWELNPVVEGIELNLEYLYIPEDYLTSGQTYLAKISLKLKGADDSTATTAFLSLQVNSHPICSGFEVIAEINDKLTLNPLECSDVDSSSYVLYQYGIKIGTDFGWLTRPVFSNSFSFRVSKGTTAAVKVCDKNLACFIYESAINSISSRNLLVNFTEYESDIVELDSIPPTIIYYSSMISNQSEYEYLLYNLTYFFTAVDINKVTFDNFVYTLLELVENALNNTVLDVEIKLFTCNYLIEVIGTFGNKINGNNLQRIIEIIASLIDGLEVEEISGFMDFVGKYGLKGSVIGKSVKVENSEIKFCRQRESGKQVNNSLSTSIGSSMYVQFPDDLNIESDFVYDILLSSYIKDSQVFEITLKRTGNIINGLTINSIDDEETVNITSSSGILVNVSGTFDSGKNYKCVYLNSLSEWASGGCSVEKVEKEYIVLSLKHLTVFSIQIEDSECGTGAGPIALMSVLVFLNIAVSLVFRQSDIAALNFPKVHKFLLIFPLTSLFFKQPMFRRAVVAVQLLTSQLLILTLIGGFNYYWDDSTESTSQEFSDFTSKHLKSGAAGWILAQTIIIPIFIMNSLLLHNWMLYKTTVPMCVFIVIGCFAGVVAMTVYYCQGWTEFWITNWLIFLGFDVVTLQVIYSLCMMAFIEPVQVELNRREDSVMDKENFSGMMVASTYRDPQVSDRKMQSHVSSSSYDCILDSKRIPSYVSSSNFDIILDNARPDPNPKIKKKKKKKNRV